MHIIIDPGRARRSINMTDNIVYDTVTDLNGAPLELKLSICAQDGNSEMRLALGRDDEPPLAPMPCLVWIPGGGWRGSDKNLMVPEMTFLADNGYVLASLYYRSSAQGHWPDQLTDVKTAIRFLRAHAAQYNIDPERIGVLGRSAGGHLAASAAMNLPNGQGSAWSGFSDTVQAACDLFGPVDLPTLIAADRVAIQDPACRWHTMGETHAGALLGCPDEEMEQRGRDASPAYQINPDMCPLLILHGDKDKLVPCSISEDFYRRIVEAGLEDRAELVILKNAGHGTREFFQPETKQRILAFFDRHLKGENNHG